MPRTYRFLSTVDKAMAEPPEAVAYESDFAVILAALLCALICVVGLIAVTRCAWLRRGSVASGSRTPGQPSANRGIKKKIIEELPKFTYNSDKEDIKSCGKCGKLCSNECAICLAEYADGDEIRVLPQCGHGFHVVCIDTWLSSHSSCPSCREILVTTRWQKCGDFLTISAGKIASEAEHKARQQSNGVSSSDYLP